MIGGIDRRAARIDVLDALHPHANADRLQDHARPGAREPVLHSPVPSNREHSSDSVPITTGVEVDDRHEDEVRAQAGEQCAALLLLASSSASLWDASGVRLASTALQAHQGCHRLADQKNRSR